MKKASMANLDYAIVTAELEPLTGRFFEKFYELGKGRFRLKFGRDSVIIELPLRLHKTKHIEQAPQATSFAMKMRKELRGRKLASISQHKKDRVIIFDFEGTQLIAELFGKGNLVLVRDGKIIAVYSREKWKDRLLLPKQEYKFPPEETKSLIEIFELKSDRAVAAELRSLDIGMSYVRAMLKEAGVEHSKHIAELTQKEKGKIEQTFQKLLLNPREFSAFSSEDASKELSELLDDYYGLPEVAEVAQTEKNKELKKLGRLLANQEEKLIEFAQKEEESKKKAAYLYEHYEDVEEILLLYKKGGLGAVEKLAKEKGWKLDKKEKTLEI